MHCVFAKGGHLFKVLAKCSQPALLSLSLSLSLSCLVLACLNPLVVVLVLVWRQVLSMWRDDPERLLREAMNEPLFLEDLTGITEMKAMVDDIVDLDIALSDDDDDEEEEEKEKEKEKEGAAMHAAK